MSSRAHRGGEAPAVRLEPDPQQTVPEGRRALLGPWSLRELVFAGGAALSAVGGSLALAEDLGVNPAGDSLYGHIALVLLPIALGLWMLLRPVVRGVNGTAAGLSLEQWGTAVSLNAGLYALILASQNMGLGISVAVIGAVLMIAATACARWIPAFARDLGHDFSRDLPADDAAPASSASFSADPSARTTAFPSVAGSGAQQPLTATTALPRASAAGQPDQRPQPDQQSQSRQPRSRQPFWFAVPERRPVREARTGTVVGHANPGVWILAREDWGTEFLVELDSGAIGMLSDVTGIERA